MYSKQGRMNYYKIDHYFSPLCQPYLYFNSNMTSCYLSPTLFKIAKGVRMFASGIIIIVYFQNLVLKDLPQSTVNLLTIVIILSNILISDYLNKLSSNIGSKKLVLLASFTMMVIGAIYAYSSNGWVLGIAGMLGLMPITGLQVPFFQKIQKQSTIHACKLQAQENKSLKRQISQSQYRFIGVLSQSLGCLVVGLYLKSVSYSDYLEKGPCYLMYAYSILCVFHFIICLFIEQAPLQTNKQQNPDLQSAIQTKITISNPMKWLLFVIFAVGVENSTLNITYIVFYHHDAWRYDLHILALIAAAAIALKYIGEHFTHYIVTRVGIIKPLLAFCIPIGIGLVFVGFSQIKPSLKIVIFLIHFLTNNITTLLQYKLKHRIIAKPQQQQFFKDKLKPLQQAAFIFGITLSLIFLWPGHAPVSFIVAGAIKIILTAIGAFHLLSRNPNSSNPHQISKNVIGMSKGYVLNELSQEHEMINGFQQI